MAVFTVAHRMFKIMGTEEHGLAETGEMAALRICDSDSAAAREKPMPFDQNKAAVGIGMPSVSLSIKPTF
ncbi:hypothetical protein Q4560_14920 [Celeribacter halophilus]|uniref:hypothetical protein n=1 Tax=Celeribacter halophilus TaxID=576117 RepID=UPI001C08625B|nr:hypothetical protein [Celeribacter halophilus]MBU2888787.1 hypothetical protein [Celeribacter halophilus]MDO6511782.1 hypothetical protein [Celeribacter halophilus]MDO6724564.1 hypothetical protein [Celeribacter halophilus]